MGCGSESSVAMVSLGGKKEGVMLGLSFERSEPSYATVVSSVLVLAVKVTPIVGGQLPMTRDTRMAEDRPVKEIPPVVPLDLDKLLCPMGKQLRSPRFSARGGAISDRGSTVTTTSGMKGQRERKRLDWSINYDKKGEHSIRMRGKDRDSSRVYEA